MFNIASYAISAEVAKLRNFGRSRSSRQSSWTTKEAMGIHSCRPEPIEDALRWYCKDSVLSPQISHSDFLIFFSDFSKGLLFITFRDLRFIHAVRQRQRQRLNCFLVQTLIECVASMSHRVNQALVFFSLRIKNLFLPIFFFSETLFPIVLRAKY